jgi:hypothetical protein
MKITRLQLDFSHLGVMTLVVPGSLLNFSPPGFKTFLIMHIGHLLYLPFTASLGNGYPTGGTHWDNTMTKHSWHTVTERFELNGHPPSGVTMNLRVPQAPRREHLNKALYQDSDQTMRCHSFPHLTCIHGATQTRRTLLPKPSFRARPAALGRFQSRRLLARTPPVVHSSLVSVMHVIA